MNSTRGSPPRGPRGCGPTRGGPQWEARARDTYAKMPLNSRQTNPQSMLLFLETALMQRNPQNFLFFTTMSPLATRARAGAAAMALDGHVGQLRPTLAPLTGQPPSTTLVPTLA